VILVKALMTPAEFNAWGWRIFFVLGFLGAIVGLIIRTRTLDSFIFEQHKNQIAILQNPALQVWKEMPLTFCAPRWSTRCSAARSSSTSCSAPIT